MPLLNLWEGLIRTTPFDQECRVLADRHYTRRKSSVGKPQFCYSGRKIFPCMSGRTYREQHREQWA